MPVETSDPDVILGTIVQEYAAVPGGLMPALHALQENKLMDAHFAGDSCEEGER